MYILLWDVGGRILAAYSRLVIKKMERRGRCRVNVHNLQYIFMNDNNNLHLDHINFLLLVGDHVSFEGTFFGSTVRINIKGGGHLQIDRKEAELDTDICIFSKTYTNKQATVDLGLPEGL